MSIGDWAQSIIGFLGILATLLVAKLVLGLERKDRKQEKLTEQRDATDLEEKRRTAEAEREKRTIRRERHKEDYGAVKRALAVFDKVFESAVTEPFTADKFEETGIEEAMANIQEIAKRVTALGTSLTLVWLAAVDLTRLPFPSLAEVGYADRPGDDRATRQHALLHDAVRSGINQHRAAMQGGPAVVKARAALADEWGDV